MLIFDALALKDMQLPKDRNVSATTGAATGALMLGGTLGAAKWMFTSKDDLGVYQEKARRQPSSPSEPPRRCARRSARTPSWRRGRASSSVPSAARTSQVREATMSIN